MKNQRIEVVKHMSVRLSDVQSDSSCTVIEIRGDLRVRQHLEVGDTPWSRLTLKQRWFSGGIVIVHKRNERLVFDQP